MHTFVDSLSPEEESMLGWDCDEAEASLSCGETSAPNGNVCAGRQVSVCERCVTFTFTACTKLRDSRPEGLTLTDLCHRTVGVVSFEQGSAMRMSDISSASHRARMSLSAVV